MARFASRKSPLWPIIWRSWLARRNLRKIWYGMMRRCYNQKDARYSSYGGRGITVCPRWHDYEKFSADMSPRPAGLSIDRIDNDKGYSPLNCRWATHLQQVNNRRPHAKNLVYKGKSCAGQRFGKLMALRYDGLHIRKSGRSLAKWFCECDCGGTKSVTGSDLRAGRVTSCGCLFEENLKRLFG